MSRCRHLEGAAQLGPITPNDANRTDMTSTKTDMPPNGLPTERSPSGSYMQLARRDRVPAGERRTSGVPQAATVSSADSPIATGRRLEM